MIKGQLKKVIATTLVAAMAVSGISAQNAKGAKKPVLAKSVYKINAGKTAVIKVKNSAKNAKVTWKSGKSSVAKIVKAVKKGKNASVTVKGIKAGTAKITATYKAGGVSKKLSCIVKVNAKSENKATATPSVTSTPTATTAPTATAAPTAAPTATPTATAVPTPQLVTAKEAVVEKNIPGDFKDKKDDVVYGEVVKTKYYSDITKSERGVNIVLPAGYDSEDTETKYPVVYMMHGIGCTKEMFGTTIDGSSCARIHANLRAKGICDEMIIVFPGIRVSDEPEDNMHSNENYKNYDNFREDLINNLIPFMEENYNAATGRENRAVCGWSMGGREALYIGLSRPDLFGYVAGYCPAFGLLPYTNPGVGKTEEGLLAIKDKEETITLPDEYKDNTYVQISAGIYDDVVNDEPKRYDTALTNGEVPHIYNEYPSGHSEGVWEPGFYILISNAFKVIE